MIICRDVLDQLESRFNDRFTCQHWLDDESGLITTSDIVAAADGWAAADSYICGPGPLMDMAEETLSNLSGIGAIILTERFVSPDDPEDAQAMPDILTPSPFASLWLDFDL